MWSPPRAPPISEPLNFVYNVKNTKVDLYLEAEHVNLGFYDAKFPIDPHVKILKAMLMEKLMILNNNRLTIEEQKNPIEPRL